MRQGVLSTRKKNSILLLDVEMARGLKNSTLKFFLLLVGQLPKKEIGGVLNNVEIFESCLEWPVMLMKNIRKNKILFEYFSSK